jgi:hypothetical protein
MLDLIKIAEIVKSSDINLTENNILDFLKIKKRWPIVYPGGQPSVEIINNLGTNTSIHFFNADSYLNYEEWKRFYDLGYTSILSNIFDLTDELRKLNEKLIYATGCTINGNFYFSKTGQIPSFDYHSHNYNVIVKQIYGISDWKIKDKTYTLKPKDTCIITKNTLHKVVSKNENKLSLTINIHE